jgi:hypothetical protein
MVQYQFRKPKFPLLLASDTIVIGAKSDSEVKKWIKKLTFQEKSSYQVIDATAEGWSYYPEHDVITPLSIDKRWTKKKIIDFYNDSIKNEDSKEEYVAKSLGNKKLTAIIEEIAQLAGKP